MVGFGKRKFWVQKKKLRFCRILGLSYLTPNPRSSKYVVQRAQTTASYIKLWLAHSLSAEVVDQNWNDINVTESKFMHEWVSITRHAELDALYTTHIICSATRLFETSVFLSFKTWNRFLLVIMSDFGYCDMLHCEL